MRKEIATAYSGSPVGEVVQRALSSLDWWCSMPAPPTESLRGQKIVVIVMAGVEEPLCLFHEVLVVLELLGADFELAGLSANTSR